MKLYQINKWGELYENSRSRTVGDLTWVPVPNRHDGECYTALITNPDGAVIFAAWNLILQVASKCNPRGILVRDNGIPHDSSSLFLKTRAPKEWFDKALTYLIESTDWLIVTELTGTYQAPITEWKGKKGMEGKGTTMPKEVEFWNSNCGDLSKIVSVSPGRLKHLYARRQDKFWVANFENAVLRVAKSKFCNGEKGWKATFDWMLRPDVVAKTIEGQYDNRPEQSTLNYQP